MKEYAVVTFAIGIKYQEYALTLADSFFLYNDDQIEFYIISNSKIEISKKYQNKINLIIDSEILTDDDVLLNKVYVDKYISEENMLLIDADSLVCKSLKPLFYLLRNESIGVWGYKRYLYDNWKGDLNELFDKEGINQLYGINGCLYFFKKNAQTKVFFQLCQEIASAYDSYNLPRVYGNFKDDEIIVSLACSKLGIAVSPPNSMIKAEKMYYSRKHINLFLGKCTVYYNNFEFAQNNIFLQNIANPIIFCLDRSTTKQFDYRLTAYFLRLFLCSNLIIKIFILIIYTCIINFYYFIKYSKWTFSNLNK